MRYGYPKNLLIQALPEHIVLAQLHIPQLLGVRIIL